MMHFQFLLCTANLIYFRMTGVNVLIFHRARRPHITLPRNLSGETDASVMRLLLPLCFMDLACNNRRRIVKSQISFGGGDGDFN